VTDEEREAVMALRAALEWTNQALHGEVYYWKWAILALHNALQGFMVLALAGSSGLGALTLKSRKKWLEAHEAGAVPPEEWLMPVPQLFEALQRPDSMRMFVGSRHFQPTDDVREAVEDLNRDRNRFVHFVPMTWIFVTDGWLETMLLCLDVIEFAGFESGNVLWSDDELREQAQMLISKFRGLAAP
jgi:hypothetical protein